MYPFAYQRVSTAQEATAACQGEARYLAGGQSLVQAMKLRLSAPERLIDLGAIKGLQGVRDEGDALVIAAMTRHAEVAASPLVQDALPALAELAAGIGDPMVRQMGTLGGSLANADPAACYPSAVLALNAQIQTDRRTVEAASFFTGLYQTALEPGELVMAVRFPKVRKAAYAKLKQPASRFALVGVFVAQTAQGVRVAVTGAKASVFREPTLEAALSREFSAAAAKAVKLSPDGYAQDLHASSAYRAAMVSVMAAKAVAVAKARSGS